MRFLYTIIIGINVNAQTNPNFCIATYTYADNSRIDNLIPFANIIGKELDVKITIKSYPSVDQLIIGIENGGIDMVLINTLGYLTLEKQNNNFDPIAVLQPNGNKKDQYKSVILASKNKNIRNLKDLLDNSMNLSIMFVSSSSTSGNFIPRLMLNNIGISKPENQFKNVKYGGTHARTLDQLLLNKIDICFIGNDEYRSRLKKDPTIKSKLRLIAKSEEIPLGPILLNKRLSIELRRKITNILTSLHKVNKSAFQSILNGWAEAMQCKKYIKISRDHYSSINIKN